MIRLDIREYCGDCCNFDADVTKPSRMECNFDYGEKYVMTDTVVRCKYAKCCEAFKRFLEKQKGDKNETSNFISDQKTTESKEGPVLSVF